MSTYFLKLGPDNLGSYARDIDRAIAGSLPCLSNRLRLQNMARLMADSLAPLLAARPGRPLHLVNIASGPGMDSLNAILLVRKEHPDLLGDRAIIVHLLDPRLRRDLLLAREPLPPCRQGTDRCTASPSTSATSRYDWSSPDQLRELTLSLRAQDAVIAGSSEGGLFEYGSDEDIVANLRAFHAATDGQAVMVGTVTRADGFSRILNEAGDGAAVRLRGMDAFAALAQRAGWRVERVVDSPLSHDVVLVKDAGSVNARPVKDI